MIKKYNCIEEYFCDILNDNFFYQNVNIPTFQKSSDVEVNILDLFLKTESRNVAAVERSSVLGNLVKSHLIIFFEFVLKKRVSVLSLINLKFSYKKADYD